MRTFEDNQALVDIISEIDFLSKVPELVIEQCIIKLYDLLNNLPLDEMDFLPRLTFLNRLLDDCYKNQSPKKVTSAVLIRWDVTENNYLTRVGIDAEGNYSSVNAHTFDPDGIIGDLSATMMCRAVVLEYITRLYPYSTPLTILDTHIRTRSEKSMIFSLVANRLLDAYDIDNLEEYEWEQLVKAAEDTQTLKTREHTMKIMIYIKDKVDKLESNKKDKVPKWVNRLEEETEAMYKNTISTLTTEEIAKNAEIIQAFLERCETIKDKKDDNEESMEAEDVADICASLSGNINKEAIDSSRYYGPVNAILGFDCISRSGPCRMFTCVCREFDNFEEELLLPDDVLENPENFWFMGECLVCKKNISKFWHAVRFPVSGGGWEGCYCSFECIDKVDTRIVDDRDNIRISQIENIIKENGIFDRN